MVKRQGVPVMGRARISKETKFNLNLSMDRFLG